MSYYDAAQASVRNQFASVIQEASERYWPFPLILVDDKPVMAGHVDAYGLMSLLRDRLKTEGER